MAASLVSFPSADILGAGRQSESTAAIHHVTHPLALIHAHVLHANWTGGWWEAALVAVKEDVNSIAEAETGLGVALIQREWKDACRTACHWRSCRRMTHLPAPIEPAIDRV